MYEDSLLLFLALAACIAIACGSALFVAIVVFRIVLREARRGILPTSSQCDPFYAAWRRAEAESQRSLRTRLNVPTFGAAPTFRSNIILASRSC